MSDDKERVAIYQCFVSTITAAENRRQQSSVIYLSLLSAGVAILGVSKTIDPLGVILPAFLVCISWFAHVYYYRNLSKAKFHVVSEIEKDWDIKPFELEWQQMENLKKKDFLLKAGLTSLEMFAPIIIGLASLAYIIYRLSSYLMSC